MERIMKFAAWIAIAFCVFVPLSWRYVESIGG